MIYWVEVVSLPATLTPLRYPGGKTQLTKYILNIIKKNDLIDGTYVEPYAGGAGVAMSLLLRGHMSQVYINDKDYLVYSFWHAMLNQTVDFIEKIRSTEVTIDEWYHQKEIQAAPDIHSELDVGFSTFFINRTARAGILKGGVIGGKAQNGTYRLNCRYNKDNLIALINRIVGYRNRIHVSNMDAVEFLKLYKDDFEVKTFVYLDPPYYQKGKQLYMNFYEHDDHANLAQYLRKNLDCPWIVSYDASREIVAMYEGLRTDDISITYSAAIKKKVPEIIIFADCLA